MVDADHARKVDYSAIYMLFPGHSLEDFPTHLTGTSAACLLNTASLAWHPRCLVSSLSMPQWHRCDAFPPSLEGALLFIPEFCRDRLPPEGSEPPPVDPIPAYRKMFIGADRTQSLRDLDRLLDSEPSKWSNQGPRNPSRLADFFALGYATLQTLLLTKQLRYTCQLDFVRLFADAQLAATCSLDGDDAGTQAALARCFDQLLEEKNRYYPTAAQILDLSVIPSKMGLAEVQKQLSVGHKINLLVTGAQLDDWRSESPEEATNFFESVDSSEQCLLGGIWQEFPEPLMPFTSWLVQWEAGQEIFRQLLSTPPNVYARLRGNLHAGWPQVLREWNYSGALHCSFSGRAVPRSSFDYVEWQSASLDSIPALTRPPLDANAPETFLQLAVRCGEQIDASHQATAILAHQANRYSDWFQDLCIVNRYGDLLGRWATAAEILESLYNPGYSDTFKYDDYREDFLSEPGSKTPFSRTRDLRQYWQNAQKIACLQRLEFMIPCISGKRPAQVTDWSRLSRHNDQLAFDRDRLKLETTGQWPLDLRELAESLNHIGDQMARSIRDLLQQRQSLKGDVAGWLLINLVAAVRHCQWDQVRRIQVPLLGQPAADTVGLANPIDVETKPRQTEPKETEPLSHARIEVPSFGFSQIPGPLNVPVATRDSRPAMVWQQGLRNEFFEVEMDATSGGIRAVRYYQKRGNLLSQRLTACLESDSSELSWRVTDFRLEQPTAQLAQALTRGELWQADRCLATYQQQTLVRRGTRQIEIRGSLTPQIKLTGSPWLNYFGSQIAWNDETSPRFREIHNHRQPLQLQRFSAPQAIEIEDTLSTIAILTQGHYWHRQTSERILDTLLAVPGDAETHFRLLLAIDEPHAVTLSHQEQTEILAIPMAMTAQRAAFRFVEVAPQSIQLLRIDPRYDEHARFQGADVWLRETEGRYSDVCLSAPRVLKSAWRLSLAGELIQSLPVQEDRVRFELQPFGITRIQWQW